MDEIKISKKHFFIGLGILILGFIIMAIGNETYAYWKLTISPILIISGYIVIAWSLMMKKKNTHVQI